MSPQFTTVLTPSGVWTPVEGGTWTWEDSALALATTGAEWAGASCIEFGPEAWRTLRNVLIEVTVTGKAEAAGLSFGPYKDFVTPIDLISPRQLQLEIDGEGNCWTFRVDGRLQSRQWWDAEVRSAEDLFAGTLTLKARRPQRVLFRDLCVTKLEASCRLSVVVTCYRFGQRLRVTLRNWCQQTLPLGAFEVLVVNPQSPDGTHEYLRAVSAAYPHIRLRELAVEGSMAKNKGAMVNRAVHTARGEWIWLTDADCLFAPDAAERVLHHISKRAPRLFFGQRRYLSAHDTAALLAGRLDGLRDFDELSQRRMARPHEDSPWGYTQIVPRATLSRLRYREDLNHYAHSDNTFLEQCRRNHLHPEQVEGLFCLHLDHPFSWYGTEAFL